MKLYFSPLACSLASRIVAYEADLSVTFVEVDTKVKRTLDGADYTAVHQMGTVPLLQDGDLQLFESAAILPYLARKAPAAKLVPDDAREAAKLSQWLSFVGTELHKTVYNPLLDQKASAEVKTYARDKAALRLTRLTQHLQDRAFLLDDFSVADAYLFTILNWSQATGIDLHGYPALAAYFERLRARPHIQRALAEELALYRAQEARRRAA